MITKEQFSKIWDEVTIAIDEAFEAGIANSGINSYCIFMALGEYQSDLENTQVNPYVINYQLDRYKDYCRQKFLVELLNRIYTFENGQTLDNEYDLNIEMMVYTHIWESKPFLKSLKRLADLATGGRYPWSVDIPDNAKHDFIRNSIRDLLKNGNYRLSDIITAGFHSSLRNAFAHSDYTFDSQTRIIKLHNYKGLDWELRKISFDAWSIRFCYSFLLAHCFDIQFYERMRGIHNYCKSDVIMVELPSKNQEVNLFKMQYHKYLDCFSILR